MDAQICSGILAKIDIGLIAGSGKSGFGQMCIEDTIDKITNKSDIGEVVKKFITKINDANWLNEYSRAAGMRKIAIAQLGSVCINQDKFTKYIIVQTIKRILPLMTKDNMLINTYFKINNIEDVVNINFPENTHWLFSSLYNTIIHAIKTNSITSISNAIKIADYISTTIPKYITKSDQILLISTQIALEALIMLDSPGCKYLYLCE